MSTGSPTQVLTADQFVEGLAEVKPASLAELLDWKNANGASFIRRADGVIWVTTEEHLTPSLKAAIIANQNTLAAFVPFDQGGDRNGDCSTLVETATNPEHEMNWEQFWIDSDKKVAARKRAEDEAWASLFDAKTDEEITEGVRRVYAVLDSLHSVA
jgi:hypothetical protein